MIRRGRFPRVESARRVEVPMIGLSYRLVVVGARSCLRTGGRRLEQPRARRAGVTGRGIRRGERSISLCLQGLTQTLGSDPSLQLTTSKDREIPGRNARVGRKQALNIRRKPARLGSFGLVRVAKTTRFRHTFRWNGVAMFKTHSLHACISTSIRRCRCQFSSGPAKGGKPSR